MSPTDFVELLRQTVAKPSVDGVISQMEKPSGRNPGEDRVRKSAWFLALSPDDRTQVEACIAEAVRSALFGTLCVLDGARPIESPADRGRLELRYIKGTSEVLLGSNDVDDPGPPLHEFL